MVLKKAIPEFSKNPSNPVWFYKNEQRRLATILKRIWKLNYVPSWKLRFMVFEITNILVNFDFPSKSL